MRPTAASRRRSPLERPPHNGGGPMSNALHRPPLPVMIVIVVVAIDVRDPIVVRRLARRTGGVYRIFFASCFASSRQLLMNSCARGLMVRFFKMTIPTGAWPSDCLTARTFNSGRLAERLYAEYGEIEINRPVASRLIRSSAGSAITVVRG